MASVRLYLDTRRERRDGTYSLKLIVSHQGVFHVDLHTPLKIEQWNNSKVINHPQKAFLNAYLKRRLVSAESLLLELSALGKLKSMDIKQLKKIIENNGVVEETESECTFIDHFNIFIARIVKPRTKEIYQYTLKRVKEFSGENLLFSDINLTWLHDFDLFLSSSGSGINARSIHMRNIRAIFNDAINHDFISQNLYPFRKFKIKNEKTMKRSLSIDDLVLFRDYPCEKHQEKYRDLFMLIFYLIGINIIDLLNLKEIRNNRIEYRRSKTGRLYSIEVLPEALAIIERYRGQNYLLDVLDIYVNYKDFAHRMNDNLQQIGPSERKGLGGKKIRQPLFPDLTTYYARHTWATIAASLDIPKETISAALGHEIGSEITSIYIDFDMRKVDEANRKVLEFVESKKTVREAEKSPQ